MPFFVPRSPYGAYLVDPAGGRHRGYIYPGYNNVSRSGQSYKKSQVFFRSLPDIEGKWKLECVLPATVKEKTFPFRFEKVPLP